MNSFQHVWNLLLGWGVPARLGQTDPETARRARLAALLLLIISPIALAVGSVHMLRGSRLQALVLFVCLVLAIASLVYLRRTGNVRSVGNFCAFLVWFAVSMAIAVRGGAGAQAVMILSLPPLIGTFVATVRDGVVWAAICIVELIVWVLLERLGVRFSDNVDASSRWVISLTMPAMFIVAIVSVSIAYVRSRDDAVRGRARAERDAARAMSEVETARADRMAAIGQLAAGVAHEINSPLAYVVGNLSFINDAIVQGESATVSKAELTQALEEALQGVLRVQRIVGDLRTYARVDAERIEPTDVERAMETALQLVQGELRHRARIVRDYAPHVPPVEADESRLIQVLVNLLVNAAHALPEGHADEQEVRLRTFCDDEGRVVLEIHDTGSGIPSRHLSHVFEPFFTTKPPGRGTGLGLSVCKGLIDGYGGTLVLESEEGKGTSAKVTLPATRASRAETVQPRVESIPVDIDPRRILVVDDDPLVRRSLERLLRMHTVSMASSGRAALDIMSRQHFDLVFCDLMMPELTGMDVHAELMARGDGQEERLVFMTGGAFTDRARRFVDTVPNRCVEKPFSPKRIREIAAKASRSLPKNASDVRAQTLPSVSAM